MNVEKLIGKMCKCQCGHEFTVKEGDEVIVNLPNDWKIGCPKCKHLIWNVEVSLPLR